MEWWNKQQTCEYNTNALFVTTHKTQIQIAVSFVCLHFEAVSQLSSASLCSALFCSALCACTYCTHMNVACFCSLVRACISIVCYKHIWILYSLRNVHRMYRPLYLLYSPMHNESSSAQTVFLCFASFSMFVPSSFSGIFSLHFIFDFVFRPFYSKMVA